MRVTELLWWAPGDRMPRDGDPVLFYERGSSEDDQPYDGCFREDLFEAPMFIDMHDGTQRTSGQVAFWAHPPTARELVSCSRCNEPCCRPVQGHNPKSFCPTCGQPETNHCIMRHGHTQWTIGPERDAMMADNARLCAEPEGHL